MGIPALIDVPRSTFTEARGINNLGQIVGDYVDSNNFRHGFLLSGGSYFVSAATKATRMDDLAYAMGLSARVRRCRHASSVAPNETAANHDPPTNLERKQC